MEDKGVPRPHFYDIFVGHYFGAAFLIEYCVFDPLLFLLFFCGFLLGADRGKFMENSWNMFPEVEPLIEEQKRDALKMTKKFGVQIGCVITRRTVRANKQFISKVFLEKILIFFDIFGAISQDLTRRISINFLA